MLLLSEAFCGRAFVPVIFMTRYTRMAVTRCALTKALLSTSLLRDSATSERGFRCIVTAMDLINCFMT